MTKQKNQNRQYMALAPLTALAGIFIDPLASTVAPLVLYFIFRNSRKDVAKTALRTADLAFSIQLWIILVSLFLMLSISVELILPIEAKQIMPTTTMIILSIFVVSLLYSIYQALNDKICNHIISFKIAERVFNLVNNRSKTH